MFFIETGLRNALRAAHNAENSAADIGQHALRNLRVIPDHFSFGDDRILEQDFVRICYFDAPTSVLVSCPAA